MPDGRSPSRATITCVEIDIVDFRLHKDVLDGSCMASQDQHVISTLRHQTPGRPPCRSFRLKAAATSGHPKQVGRRLEFVHNPRNHRASRGDSRRSLDARAAGGPFHDSPASESTTILARMPSAINAAVDRRLEDLIVAWTRRQHPALRRVPARWIRPVVAPAAVRLRRLLWRGVLAAATPIAMILVLLIVKL
jgi:hypothetical protein